MEIQSYFYSLSGHKCTKNNMGFNKKLKIKMFETNKHKNIFNLNDIVKQSESTNIKC